MQLQKGHLTHLPLEDVVVILKYIFPCYSSLALFETSLMINQHWFRCWFGAIKQQAITWAKIDPDICRHMATMS